MIIFFFFFFLFFLKIGKKETKKRCLMETEMSEYDINTNVDLELRLSPPGESLRSKSSHQSKTLPLDLNSGDYPHNSIAEVPSLCLMGCTRCLLYVMVPKADPKCPKCKSSSLMDSFRDTPAKRSRKSYFASSNKILSLF